MKKSIICIIIALLIFSDVYAITPFSYGDSVSNNTMEGYSFYGIYGGKDATSKTTDEAYGGRKSLKVDVAALNEPFNFSAEISATQTMKDNSLYFQLYVKGYDTKPSGFKPLIIFRQASGNKIYAESMIPKVIIHDDPVENGWHKIWAVVTPDFDYSACILGAYYTKNTGDDAKCPYLYFDDMIIRTVPIKTEIRDIVTDKSSVNLKNVILKGYDKYNNNILINSTDLLNWEIIDGEAYIDKWDNLIYTGKTSGSVNLQSSFYGVVKNINVEFTKKYVADELVDNNDTTYSLTVANTSNENIDATIFTALYDGDILYKIYTTKENIAPGDTKTLTTNPIEIPYDIKNPVIKAFTWDDIYN